VGRTNGAAGARNAVAVFADDANSSKEADPPQPIYARLRTFDEISREQKNSDGGAPRSKYEWME
jgi:hypothetical protein